MTVPAAVGVILAILALPPPEGMSPEQLAPPTFNPVDDHLEVAPPGLPPTITVRADTPSQLGRLTEALLALEAAGMTLPALEISFFDAPESCSGAKGLFDPSRTPWRILICTEIKSVVAHELAHAWVTANVNRELRSEFIEFRGLKHWEDRDVPWNERGTEWAAVVVQQGLDGLPLPSVLSNEAKSRLESFELLTGRVAPILVEWIKNKVVPCQDRPTDLSRLIADGSGRTCADVPSCAKRGSAVPCLHDADHSLTRLGTSTGRVDLASASHGYLAESQASSVVRP